MMSSADDDEAQPPEHERVDLWQQTLQAFVHELASCGFQGFLCSYYDLIHEHLPFIRLTDYSACPINFELWAV
uniref:Myotubularin phosphatase domain-containing protein n=1 Tax=Angiostrongylus cantonensis TaxID=6313 RepID=A0A0K0CW14_ANGCA